MMEDLLETQRKMLFNFATWARLNGADFPENSPRAMAWTGLADDLEAASLAVEHVITAEAQGRVNEVQPLPVAS
jgi:hypothetical protein